MKNSDDIVLKEKGQRGHKHNINYDQEMWHYYFYYNTEVLILILFVIIIIMMIIRVK